MADLPVYEYTPIQIKQAITGTGRADKKQVTYMVMKLLHLTEEPKPDDTADALAIAITGLNFVREKILWRNSNDWIYQRTRRYDWKQLCIR